MEAAGERRKRPDAELTAAGRGPRRAPQALAPVFSLRSA